MNNNKTCEIKNPTPICTMTVVNIALIPKRLSSFLRLRILYNAYPQISPTTNHTNDMNINTCGNM